MKRRNLIGTIVIGFAIGVGISSIVEKLPTPQNLFFKEFERLCLTPIKTGAFDKKWLSSYMRANDPDNSYLHKKHGYMLSFSGRKCSLIDQKNLIGPIDPALFMEAATPLKNRYFPELSRDKGIGEGFGFGWAWGPVASKERYGFFVLQGQGWPNAMLLAAYPKEIEVPVGHLK